MKLSITVKHTFLYGLSIVLMRGISLIMLPFVAHYLVPSEFGRLEVLSSISMVGSVLVGLGLDNSLFRFVGQAQTKEDKSNVAGQIFTLALVAAAFTVLLSFIAVSWVVNWLPGELTKYQVSLVFYSLALEGLIAVPLGWLRMNNHALTFFSATVGRVVLQASLTVLFLLNIPSVEDVLEAGFIAALTLTAFLFWRMMQDMRLGWNRARVKQVLTYSYPIIISGLVAFVLMGLDRVIIAEFTNLTQVAIYGVAVKFAIAVVLLLQPYTIWWSPKRFEVLSLPGGARKAASFISMGLVFLVLATFLVMTSAAFVIELLMPETYYAAIEVLLILALAMAFKEAAELINIGCFINDKTHAQMWVNIMASAIGLLGLWLWVPVYGAIGAAYALLLAQAIKTLIFFFASQYFHRLDYPLARVLCFSTVVLGVAGLMQTLEGSIWRFIVGLLCLPLMIYLAIQIKLLDKRVLIAEK